MKRSISLTQQCPTSYDFRRSSSLSYVGNVNTACSRRSSSSKIYLFTFSWLIFWIFYAMISNDQLIPSRLNEGKMQMHQRNLYMNSSTSQKLASNQMEASACLIIKDDNPMLIEWLAYHYQVLPLRHLIVASDPSSLTKPTDILDRWRRLIPDLNILKWTEKDYQFNRTWANSKGGDDPFLIAEYSLVARQRGFYSSCASYFKEHKRTWVFIFDVDEYVVFNTLHDDDPVKSEELEKFYSLPRQHTIKRYRKRRNDWMINHEEGLKKLREQVPKIGSKTVLEFIAEIRNDPFSPFNLRPSYTMPRLFHSAIEATVEERSHLNLLTDFDPSKFLTLQYFRHAEKGAFPWNRYGKSMFDVSRIPIEYLKPSIHEHQGVGYTDDSESIFYSESLLRINHYLGSWDAYQRPDDDRRSRKDFEERARVNNGKMYSTTPWLNAFIENVGIAKAKLLLEDVGDYSWKQNIHK